MKVSPGRTVLCRCGHELTAHQHYRRGRECALCGCLKWSPPGRLHLPAADILRRLFRRQKS